MRRPRYYAAVYTGKTSQEWVVNEREPAPFREGWKLVAGAWQPTTAASKKNVWWPTQGLSMVWTPEYGTCVLAKNWNVWTANMVRADLGEGKVSWPDYWSFSHEYDETASTLTMTSKLIDLPLTVTRTVTFLEEGVKQEVVLNAEGEVSVQWLAEPIPFLNKEEMTVR